MNLFYDVFMVMSIKVLRLVLSFLLNWIFELLKLSVGLDFEKVYECGYVGV